MPRKNANGSGSIYFDKQKGRYVAAITVGVDSSGKPQRRKVTGRTQDEVRERLASLKKAVAADPGLPAEATVAHFLKHWLEDVLPLTDVKQSTRDNYAMVVRAYINPHVGSIRLDKLQPAHVRKMLTNLSQEGKKGNTLRLARATLRRALRTAERDGLVTRNVAALVDGVSLADAKQGRTLTIEQARHLLSHLKGHELEPVVTLLLTTGLRRGEAAGLVWDDVKLTGAKPHLTVRSSLHIAGDGSQYMDDPKTRTSRRAVTLTPEMVDLLRSHRAAQNEQRLAFGEGWGSTFPDHEFVFTNGVGQPMDMGKLTNSVKRLTAECGLGEWTPHELRHSCGSILMAMDKNNLKQVSEMLGHSSIRVTADIYGHLMEDAKHEMASAMSTALWG